MVRVGCRGGDLLQGFRGVLTDGKVGDVAVVAENRLSGWHSFRFDSAKYGGRSVQIEIISFSSFRDATTPVSGSLPALEQPRY